MEIVLAIVVASAVIFFGALISMGNERQRKAIDQLRDQIEYWAIHNLQIQREGLTRDVRVDDPLRWLNKIIIKCSGQDMDIQISNVFEEPQALLCMSSRGKKVIFTTLSPTAIRKLNRGKRNRLSQNAGNNPLFSIPKKVETYEISVLNSGILFDLEFQLAWKGITGHDLIDTNRMWVYCIP